MLITGVPLMRGDWFCGPRTLILKATRDVVVLPSLALITIFE
jgi:hypothetical protein